MFLNASRDTNASNKRMSGPKNNCYTEQSNVKGE